MPRPRMLLASAALIVLPVACGARPAGTTTAPHALGSPAPPVPERAAPAYLLLEPIGGEASSGLARMRELSADDPRRPALDELLARPYPRWVLELGRQARQLAKGRCTESADVCARTYDHPAFFAIMKGGNRPKRGLSIEGERGTIDYPDAWYVEVDPERADTLIPHEYGHAIMFELLPGDLPDHPASLPHTTGAITDDVTALSEGWGIHFETLAADRRESPDVYANRHRDAFGVDVPILHGDSLLAAKDLLSYSQSYRRYTCVKENCFAYLPRVSPVLAAGGVVTPQTLLARWTDTTYDPAQVRSLAQMVASEGVVAALFYRLATAPAPAGPAGNAGDPALPEPARYLATLTAFATLTEDRLAEAPAILVFLESLLQAAEPAERARIARIAPEVLHYTPMLPDAQEIYADLHERGHAVDHRGFMQRVAEVEPRMKAALQALVADPSQLLSGKVRELWVKNERFAVGLPTLGLSDGPLFFDLNSAPVEVLMTVPGIDFKLAEAIRAARDGRGGFDSIDQLAQVPGVGRRTIAAVQAMRAAYVNGQARRLDLGRPPVWPAASDRRARRARPASRSRPGLLRNARGVVANGS